MYKALGDQIMGNKAVRKRGHPSGISQGVDASVL